MTTTKKIPGISNIIFDLGGVLLNIDYHKTEQAFVTWELPISTNSTPSFMLIRFLRLLRKEKYPLRPSSTD
jgi:hypothetical protein